MGGIAGNDDNRKQSHCEIEKRRRDKMNHYITELASVIPAFNNNQSRLDKLTVLRMAVQHVKSLRSSLCSFSSFHLRPSFLSSGNLLKNLILQMASQEAQDNLFMVVTCDRGKVLFVSKSSKDILNQDQSELVGQSLFDILHKDDVSKVKEQISYFNLMPKEMLVDSKTLQPIKSNQRESFIQLQNQSTSNTLQPGSKRSFFCRMKSGRIWPPSNPRSSKSQTSISPSLSSSSPASSSTTSSSSSSSSSSSACKKSHHEELNYHTDSAATQQNKHHKHQHQSKTKSSQRCHESNTSSGRQHKLENRCEKNKQTSSGGKSTKCYKRNERHLSHNYHNQQERQQSCDFEKSNSVYSSGSTGSGQNSSSSSGSDSSSGISSAPASSSSRNGSSSSGGGSSSGDQSKSFSGAGGGGGGGGVSSSHICCAKMTKKSRDAREASRERTLTTSVAAAAAAAKIVDKTADHHGRSSKTKHVAARGNYHHNQKETLTRGLSSLSADGSGNADRKQSSARASGASCHVNGAGNVRQLSSGSSAGVADRTRGDSGGLDSHGSSISGHSSGTSPSQDDGRSSCGGGDGGGNGERGSSSSSTTTNKSSPLSSSSSSSSSPQSSSLSPLSTSDDGYKSSADKNNVERNKQKVESNATNGDSCDNRASSRESSTSTTGNSNDESGQSSSGSAGTGCTSLSLSSTNVIQNGGVYNRKQWNYIVMHCSGYLKAITLRNDEYDDDDFDEKTGGGNSSSDDNDDDSNHDNDNHKDNTRNKEDSNFRTVNCLVAVCRRSVLDRYLKPDRPLTFTCRYSMEGKFAFVDQRTTVALGYTPQQLMGTSHYAYCHKDSVNTFKECHRQCILKPDTVFSDIYQFKRANGQYLWLQTSLKSFRNPWTKFIDYIVANHTTAEGSDPKYNEGCVPTKFNQDMTCEASSQSLSPTSSSSVPSEECKKSTSPSSSSIGSSSYSMDSYASGGSIQALLNQIDRVKSGGLRHSLELPKKRSGACHHHQYHNHNHHHHHHHGHGHGHGHHHNHHKNNHHNHNHHKRSDATASSGGSSSSAGKSNDDTGNFSDIQSCSSISSQNSSSLTSSGDGFTQSVNKFVNQASNVSLLVKSQTSNITTDKTQTMNSSQAAVEELEPSSTSTSTQSTTIKLASNTTNNSAGRVTCMVESTSSYQFDSQKQEQQQTMAKAGYEPLEQADLNNCGQQQQQQQQNFERHQVLCPAAVPMTDQPTICAVQNFPQGTTNLVPSNGANDTRHEQHYISDNSCKTGMGAGPRMVTARVQRHPSINSTSAIRPLQRPYQYSYRAPQIKFGRIPTETVTGALGPPSWSQQASAYIVPGSSDDAGPGQVVKNRVGNNQVVGGKEQATRQRQHEYVIQQQQQQQQQHMSSVHVVQIPQSMQSQPNADFNTQLAYQNTFTQQPVVGPTYMNQATTVDSRYTDVSMSHPMGQVQDNSLTPMSMGGQQQQQQQASLQQGQQSNELGIPMIWNPSGGTYTNMMTTSMHTHGQSQMGSCHQVPAGGVGGPSNMVAMNVVPVNQPVQMDMGGHQSHCQQCAGHKCCTMNQPMVMASNNSGDFNSMHLSTLAVDDLDESELLECLAACDPDSQMYNMQNNNYQQYNNVYRGQQ